MDRRGFLKDFIKVSAALAVISFIPRSLLAMGVATPGHSNLNFSYIYSNARLRDEFYGFLQNVYSIYPDREMHDLIYELTQSKATDEEIYRELQRRLPEITPFLNIVTHSLPALSKQKKEMAKQAQTLLASNPKANGYLEIGTSGRYAHGIQKAVKLEGPRYTLNTSAPSFSPEDMIDRGRISRLGDHISLEDYDGLDEKKIPKQSIDLVSNYIGFHHAAPEKRDHFIRSVADTLRPGGRLLVRDHDAKTDELRYIAALAHDVFNAGTDISWEQNLEEIRNFVSVDEIEERMKRLGFHREGPLLLQEGDPTQNTLMVFVKA